VVAVEEPSNRGLSKAESVHPGPLPLGAGRAHEVLKESGRLWAVEERMPRDQIQTFVKTIEAEFERLPEPRQLRIDSHPLTNILTFALGSLLCDGSGWEDMAVFAIGKARLFAGVLDLSNGTPSADTFRRVFEDLDPELFRSCVSAWLLRLASSLRGQVVSGDGKSLAGTATPQSPTVPVHLLHIYASSQKLLLGFKPVPGAPGEVAGLKELIQQLPLAGAIFTTDANGCTKKVIAALVAKQCHYVLALKGNRGALHQAAIGRFAKAEQAGWSGVDRHKSRCVGHGRIEERHVYAMELGPWPFKGKRWDLAKTIVRVDRYRWDKGMKSQETAYYLSDLDPEAERLGEIIREHWQVENRLHHVLDVTFGEDRRRVRDQNSATNLAGLSRLALAVLEKDDEPRTLRKKRQLAALSDDYLLKLLSACFP
jgi:predicted transposase YbfD/YdcC